MSTTGTAGGRRTRPVAKAEPGTPALGLQQLAARVEELAATLAELTQIRAEQRGGEPNGQADKDTPEQGPSPLYGNVEDWVREYLLVNVARPFGEVGLQRWYWCPQWWRHNEAVTALTALWYAWEHARLEPTGMIGWLHELHYHLGVICSADGPFRECASPDGDRAAKHRGDQFADAVPAPANWWNWWSNAQ